MKLKPTKLREFREAAGLSRSELARKAKMQASDVGMAESGRFIPYDVQMRRIADVLGIDNPDTLLEPLEVEPDACTA